MKNLTRNERLAVLAPELLKALKLAAAYVGKGVADGAYDGCAVSGEKSLAAIEETIRKADGRGM